MNGSPNTESAEQIRREMARTRAEMSRTIGELQRRLDPALLKEQAKDVAYEATVGKARHMVQDAGDSIKRTGNGFVQSVKDNPLPAAIAVLSVGWLFMRARSAAAPVTYRAYPGVEPYQPSEPSRIDDMKSRIGDKAEAIKDDMKDRASDVADRATALAHSAQMQVRDVAHRAEESGRRAGDALQRTFTDNPLAIGLGVVAAGIVIGLTLPITRTEDEWLGSARDKVVDKAQEAAQGALQQVRDTAQKVDQVAGKLQPEQQQPPNGIAPHG